MSDDVTAFDWFFVLLDVFIHCLHDQLINLLITCVNDWLIGWLLDWTIDLLIAWVMARFIDWWNDWHVSWLIKFPRHEIPVESPHLMVIFYLEISKTGLVCPTFGLFVSPTFLLATSSSKKPLCQVPFRLSLLHCQECLLDKVLFSWQSTNITWAITEIMS